MTLQHLRSSTANKRPLPGSMSDGQIAINTNTSSPGLFFKDSAGALVKVGPVHVGSTAPNVSPAGGGETGNTVGEQWLDTAGSTYVFKVWDGSAWRSEAGEFVNTTGDTMTGALGIIAGSASAPGLFFSGDANSGLYSPGADQVAISTGGAGRLFVDANGSVVINTPTSRSNITSSSRPSFQVEGTNYDSSLISVLRNSDTAGAAPTFVLARTRGSTLGSNSAVQSGDFLGRIAFESNGGSSFSSAASIIGIAGASGAGDLTFNTTSSGSGSVSERLRITSAGLVGIGTSSPSKQFVVSDGGNIGYEISPNDSANPGLMRSLAYNRVTAAYVDHFTQANNFVVGTGSSGTERARIDSSGRLLVGTSTARGIGAGTFGAFQIEQAGLSIATITTNTNDTEPGYLVLGKSRGTSVGSSTIVQNGDRLGEIRFAGGDGTDVVSIGASIRVEVDGTPGADDMPGRLVFSTTADGASSPTEEWRITNDGVVCYNQLTPTSKSAAATLTVAELKTGIIQYTGAAATLTLPTGTLTEGGFSGIYTNMAFEWSVINTGSGTCTIGNGTSHTVTGSATVAAGTSGRFASRRTAANTFVSYRLS